MRVAEKLDWKGLKINKSVGNRKIMSEKVRHYDDILFMFFSFKTVG
jgi:hypothetical protein